MKSEWKVTSNCIGGEWFYGVYRLRDRKDVDHSGNREPRISSFLMRLKTCLGENLTRKTKPRPRRSHDC